MEEKHKNKGGRPKKIIDYETVKKLASIMCTQEEIANHLELSVKTLQRDEKFSLIYKQGQDTGKMSLRRAQFKTAIDKGNSAMQIWLGKQYLGQKENVIEEDKKFEKVEELLSVIKKESSK